MIEITTVIFVLYTLNLDEKNEIGNIDATYGLKGAAAPWVISSTDKVLMKGGAEQIVTPLNAEMLEKIGTIPKY